MPENPLASRAGGPDPPVSGKNLSYLQALGSAVGKFRLYTRKTASFIFNGILKQRNLLSLLCLPFVRGETSHAESEDTEPLTNPEEIDIDEDEDDEDENGATLLSLLLFS